MGSDETEQQRYLHELCSMTEGETTGQASMFDVGAAIGLDRSASGALAEDLLVEGLVELKTLSGGISITPEGLRLIDRETTGNSETIVVLGKELVVGSEVMAAVQELISEIKAGDSGGQTIAQLEEVVFDIKTLEIQLLSPRPKTAVVREIFRSLAEGLASAGKIEIKQRIMKMVGE